MKRTRKYNPLEGILLPQDIENHLARENALQIAEKQYVLETIKSLGLQIELYCGVDNGVTGAITILNKNGDVLLHKKTPVTKCLNYTKKKAFVNLVNPILLKQYLQSAGEVKFCMIERPMINPTRFTATISAVRCLEATESMLKQLQIPYQFIDSKEWQKALLPSGLKGDELKLAAADVAKRLYPRLKVENADSLLIALHCLNKMK